MARERMVTRTIVTMTAEVLCVNIETKEVTTRNFTISKLDNPARVLATIQKTLPYTIKAVTLTGTTETETLYGMPENEFIKLAKVLPPR